MTADCEKCHQLFDGTSRDKELALRLCTDAPEGECEVCSVSDSSPGAVADTEDLYRVMVDPRDFDDGQVAQRPFRAAFTNGLSVIRSVASDQEVTDLVEDGMWHRESDPPREIRVICSASAKQLRDYLGDASRVFYVYDQTVPRRVSDTPPVPSHAGVFARVPPKGQAGRTAYIQDMAGELRRLFLQNRTGPAEFRAGLLGPLNEMAYGGMFAHENEPAD